MEKIYRFWGKKYNFMRVFIIGWNNSNQELVLVAKKLEQSGHEILYWVGNEDDESYEQSRQEFSNTIFHRRRDAILGIPPAEFKHEEFEPLGADFIEQFFETESILSTMKNFEKLPKSTLEKKRLYHSWLEYWHGLIKKLKPEIILFAWWPHTGYNYVVYCLAKFMGIKTILFEYTRVASRVLLINDFTIGSHALRQAIESNKNARRTVEELSLDIKKYYLSQQTQAKALPVTFEMKDFKKQYSGINLLGIKLKIIWRSILDFSIFQKTYKYLFKQLNGNLKKEYTSYQTKAQFSAKYVYFALQYQPECSTSPLGGVFVDQLLMIKILAAAIPPDWLIYVKEHPYQWMPSGLSYFNYRYHGYYESIAKIKKVRLVPFETNTFDLINQAQAVATVTGTTGWEAAIRRKPTLMFGYAWYRDCPGVFYVNNVESCRRVIGKILAGFTVSEPEIINYLISLDQIGWRGYLSDDWTKNEAKMNQEENVNNIHTAIKKELNN